MFHLTLVNIYYNAEQSIAGPSNRKKASRFCPQINDLQKNRLCLYLISYPAGSQWIQKQMKDVCPLISEWKIDQLWVSNTKITQITIRLP